MVLNIFLYGYLPFMVVCFFTAAWFKWFSCDQKSSLGALIALLAGIIPIVNIVWVILAIWDIPWEIKQYNKAKKTKKVWENKL